MVANSMTVVHNILEDLRMLSDVIANTKEGSPDACTL
jgi:hypothetical protein